MLDEDPVVFDVFSQILMNFIWQYKLSSAMLFGHYSCYLIPSGSKDRKQRFEKEKPTSKLYTCSHSL